MIRQLAKAMPTFALVNYPTAASLVLDDIMISDELRKKEMMKKRKKHGNFTMLHGIFTGDLL